MNSDKLKAACLAATLATAWAAPSADAGGIVIGDTYYVRSNNHLTWLLNDVRIVGLASGSGGGYQYADLGSMDSGEQYRSFILDGGNPVDRFATIGWLSNMSLFVSMPDSSSAVGVEFADLFGSAFDEAVLIEDLASGGASPMFEAFVQRLDQLSFTSPPEVVCDTVHFSQGQLLGTFLISANPIPEPGFASILVLSGLTLLYRRR